MSIFAPPNTGQYPWPDPGSFGDLVYNTNPSTAYQQWLNQYGLSWNQGPLGTYARSLFGRSQDQYEAMLPQQGLGYRYTDFLRTAFPQIFERSWSSQTPNQQGLSSASPGVGRLRMVGWPTG